MITETKGEYPYRIIKDWLDDTSAPYRRSIGMSDFYQAWGSNFNQGITMGLFFGTIKPLLDGPTEIFTSGMNRYIGVRNSIRAASWVGYEFGKMGVDATVAFLNGTERKKSNLTKFMDEFGELNYSFKGGPEEIINRVFEKTSKPIPVGSYVWRKTRDFVNEILLSFEKATSLITTRGAYYKTMQDANKAQDVFTSQQIKDRVSKAIRFNRTPKSKIDQPLFARDIKNANLKRFTTFAVAMVNRITNNLDMIINGSMQNDAKFIDNLFARIKAGSYVALTLAISGGLYSLGSGSWWSKKDNEDDGYGTTALKVATIGLGGTLPLFGPMLQAYFSDNPNAGLYNDIRFDHIQRTIKSFKNLQEKGQLSDKDIENFMVTGSAFGPIAPVKGIINNVRFFSTEEGQKALSKKGLYSPEVAKGARRGYSTKTEKKEIGN